MVAVEKPKVFLEKLRDKPSLDRASLLLYLDEVCHIAFTKLYLKNSANTEKMGLGRVIVSAVGVATPLLRDAELSELKGEVAALRQLIEQGV